ncbi:hypothetical protein AMTRI_Chr01g114680 [Amborella trichopoda]
MDSKSVFNVLQEVFPQIDLRILKAVAFEHSDNVDAAMDFLMDHVIPNIKYLEEAPRENMGGEDKMQNGDHKLEELNSSSKESHSPLSSEMNTESYKANTSYDSLHSMLPHSNSVSVGASDKGREGEHHDSYLEAESFANNVLIQVEPLLHHEERADNLESLVLEKDFSGLGVASKESSAQGSLGSDVELLICHNKLPHSDNENQSPTIACKSGLDIDLLEDFIGESHNYKEFSEIGIATEEPPPQGSLGNVVATEEPPLQGSLGSDVQILTFDNEFSSEGIDNENHSSSVSSQSAHTPSVEDLEDFIGESRNYKKTLLDAMESLRGLVKEAEVQEEAAGQAKKEADQGAQEILTKVEDLKQMLSRAKEANDLHSGEVYGEKSILATEARELQSRLLHLSEEKDKFLHVIDEMRSDLEVRIAAAKEQRVAAEKEKQLKEDAASAALAEQELIMEKVVEESKKLQQAAEENSKLREFLIDRGRIVDTLQGEISVICEDVSALKEKFDKGLKIGEMSLRLPKSSEDKDAVSVLSSSTSSMRSRSLDSSNWRPQFNTVPNRYGLSESFETASRDLSSSQETIESKIDGDQKAKSSSEEGWHFLEDELTFN